MGIVVQGQEEATVRPAPGPGMICLTAGPEEIILTPALEQVLGALTMRAAAGEEGGDEAEEQAGLTNLPATLSMNLDRNQEHARMNAILTRVLAVAPASSSEPFRL